MLLRPMSWAAEAAGGLIEDFNRVHFAEIDDDAAVQRYVTDVLTPEQLEMLGSIAETVLLQLEEPQTHTR